MAGDRDELAEIAADVFRTLLRARHDVIHDAVCERGVTLGVATILEAREVIVLVSGQAKRAPLARMLERPVAPDLGSAP